MELPIIEGLVIPMFSGITPVGSIWIAPHKPVKRFDAEHVRIMTSLGVFAVSALEIKPTIRIQSRDPANAYDAPAKKRQDAPLPSEEFAFQREIVWREYVRRVAQKDEQALEALLEETRALVFGTALRIVGFQVDAEEVAADVYARVWTMAGAYDPCRGPVGGWLVTMARSIAIDA